MYLLGSTHRLHLNEPGRFMLPTTKLGVYFSAFGIIFYFSSHWSDEIDCLCVFICVFLLRAQEAKPILMKFGRDVADTLVEHVHDF